MIGVCAQYPFPLTISTYSPSKQKMHKPKCMCASLLSKITAAIKKLIVNFTQQLPIHKKVTIFQAIDR